MESMDMTERPVDPPPPMPRLAGRLQADRGLTEGKLPNEPNFTQAGVEKSFWESQKRTQIRGSMPLGIGIGLAEVAPPDDVENFFGQFDGLAMQPAAVDGAVDQVTRIARLG